MWKATALPFKAIARANALDGGRAIAHLMREHAEKMRRVGMARVGLENPPINLLGGLQPAGLMVLDRNRQCLGNRRHAAYYGDAPAGRNAVGGRRICGLLFETLAGACELKTAGLCEKTRLRDQSAHRLLRRSAPRA